MFCKAAAGKAITWERREICYSKTGNRARWFSLSPLLQAAPLFRASCYLQHRLPAGAVPGTRIRRPRIQCIYWCLLPG